MNLLRHRAASNALRTDAERLVRAPGRHVDLLEIGTKPPRRNARNLRTNTSEVLGLPTMGDFIPLHGLFSTHVTCLTHLETLPNAWLSAIRKAFQYTGSGRRRKGEASRGFIPAAGVNRRLRFRKRPPRTQSGSLPPSALRLPPCGHAIIALVEKCPKPPGGPPPMPRHLTLMLLTPCFACLVSLVRAELPDAAAASATAETKKEKDNATSYVTLVRERSGQQTLAIHYRWNVHSQASVEVRLMPADAPAANVAPLYFVREYFKGDVSRKIYHCLDAAEGHETADSFTKDKLDFQIIGRRNALDRPAVLILPHVQPEKPSDKAADKAPKNPSDKAVESADSPRAVFPLLDAWALNDRSLSLELPRETFATAGQLHVWFLRSDRVLWEETVPWPGDGKKAEKKVSPGR